MSEVSSHNQFFKIVKYERGLDKLLVKGKESMSFIDIKEIILVQSKTAAQLYIQIRILLQPH
ncbi:hypothetical protein GCM10023142_38710 [Anaerocolumna aminovalerica]|uniref:hypothetical protein n=1 Tax=Anaerocolumna aminovalerica TaxID=1527 RepID=UPI001FA8C54F|nr:hypothetical protein [Anaerocolumna aminovalerica]